MSATEFSDQCSFVGGAVVDEQEKSTPSAQCELEKPDELALSFALVECVREPSSGSRAKHICADVLVIDEY